MSIHGARKVYTTPVDSRLLLSYGVLKNANAHGAFWRRLESNLLVSEADEKPKTVMNRNVLQMCYIEAEIHRVHSPTGTQLCIPENGQWYIA